MAEPEAHSEETLTDQEFLRQIRDRLKKTGNFVLIVDAPNVQFARIVSVVLGFGVLVLLTLFGFNVEKMGEELAAANRTLSQANSSLDAATQALNQKRTAFEAQFTGVMEEAEAQLLAVAEEEERVRRVADRNLEQAITTFADLISEANVGSGPEGAAGEERLTGIMRNYLQRNIDFARQEKHTAVEIAMLRRLALLEYDLEDTDSFSEHFETAIGVAERARRYDLAADLQVEYADVRAKSFSQEGAPVTAKARLLLQSALLNYERESSRREEGDTRLRLAKAVAHTRLGETYELESAAELALAELDEARALYIQLPPSDDQLNVIDRQARLHEELGHHETAKRLINESISVAEDLGKYNFVSDKHLRLARMATAPNEITSQLCRALRALKRLPPDSARTERFLGRAAKVQPEFEAGTC